MERKNANNITDPDLDELYEALEAAKKLMAETENWAKTIAEGESK